MPDMQQPQPGSASLSLAALDAASRCLDDDYALGCECADPRLQIERWAEAPPSAGELG
ncbi:hypothetical protein [Caenimonas sedimenti]|uniref:hypothetical protein n=1 Tax=Caenimonas sedimenti TaxID=2596921 RepID=UPI00164666AB|nr:hypothetical protein [Caenimonas sedimenti]